MSAFIVSKRHIDVLVDAAERAVAGPGCFPLHWGADGTARRFPGPGVGADDVGRMLWQENLNSLRARYPTDRDGHRPGPASFRDDEVLTYQASPVFRRPTVVEALKALDCYEYQSCEHAGWEGSDAHGFCRALRHRLISLLPGYATAPWEWSEAHGELR